jgi:hypothetical protein
MNSLLTQNSVSRGSFSFGGAVIINEKCNSTFLDSTFSHNSATGGAGGAVNIRSDTYIDGCDFENNTAATGGAIRYGPTGTVTVGKTVFSSNAATTAGGAMQSSFEATPAKLSATVVFSGNTAFCCYAKASITRTTTANSTCVDIAYRETPISECCPVDAYSDGEHCQQCTSELTCAGTVGANTSTVIYLKEHGVLVLHQLEHTVVGTAMHALVVLPQQVLMITVLKATKDHVSTCTDVRIISTVCLCTQSCLY